MRTRECADEEACAWNMPAVDEVIAAITAPEIKYLESNYAFSSHSDKNLVPGRTGDKVVRRRTI